MPECSSCRSRLSRTIGTSSLDAHQPSKLGSNRVTSNPSARLAFQCCRPRVQSALVRCSSCSVVSVSMLRAVRTRNKTPPRQSSIIQQVRSNRTTPALTQSPHLPASPVTFITEPCSHGQTSVRKVCVRQALPALAQLFQSPVPGPLSRLSLFPQVLLYQDYLLPSKSIPLTVFGSTLSPHLSPHHLCRRNLCLFRGHKSFQKLL